MHMDMTVLDHAHHSPFEPHANCSHCRRITIRKFTKREAVRLKHQGEGIFEYEKLEILKDGKPVGSFTMIEAQEMRDALIAALPQGIFLSDLEGIERS